jgi:ferredoxin-NADP reductase
MPFRTFTARLTRSIALSEQTRHLEFEMQGIPRFDFVAGQWLSLKHRQSAGQEITRAYSIASPPEEGNGFALCLNRVPHGFMSNFLYDLREGEELSCQGPFGDFILRPPVRDTIFIATGTGIAPFRSMLRWVLGKDSRHQGKQFWLVFGSRFEADIYYHQEFVRLAAEHANFHYLPTLSRGGTQWTGRRGYVQDHVRGTLAGRTDIEAYVCGLDKMIQANCDLLESLGWKRKAIRYEKYD